MFAAIRRADVAGDATETFQQRWAPAVDHPRRSVSAVRAGSTIRQSASTGNVPQRVIAWPYGSQLPPHCCSGGKTPVDRGALFVMRDGKGLRFAAPRVFAVAREVPPNNNAAMSAIRTDLAMRSLQATRPENN
jgi:hypothetical protein